MEGEAIARWVRRHPVEARFLAGLDHSGHTVATMIERVRRRDPRATSRDIRAEITRLHDG